MPTHAKPLLEICTPSLPSALTAATHGAARIELCTALSTGGLTPSAGTILTTLSLLPASFPIHVLIRPRPGNFTYTPAEIQSILADISFCRSAGCAGVVVGVLNAHDRVDVECMRGLVEAARPMSVTFHRAFDEVIDLSAALEDVIQAGCDRVLTSGGQSSAVEGAEAVAGLVRQAAGRIVVMAGAGVNHANVRELVGRTGVVEVHASASATVAVGVVPETRRGMFDAELVETSGELVAKLAAALDGMGTELV